ncbi:MAG: hypothetical protein CMB64_04645 [Euryarchaeota archaeon]|nr:hypothetical protein [Euryarchaeota archaeon]|tara:strand:- start:955 stop:2547 length:1593 start_codon:yes stop_codon:yes gene_type:complete
MELRDHQKKCVDFILKTENRGLILYHGLGTGKTFTSISMFEALYKNNNELKAAVVVPAKLIANYEKEISNAKVRNKNAYSIFSYDGFTKMNEKDDDDIKELEGVLEKMTIKQTKKNKQKRKVNEKELELIHDNPEECVLILDEAHLLRNAASKKTDFVLKFANKCYKVIILTGTPFVNYANDIAVLYNMIETQKSKKLETSWGTWKKKYFKTIFTASGVFPFTKITKSVRLKEREVAQLMLQFEDKISCVNSDIENFPRSYFYTKKVEMSNDQYTVYKAMEEELMSKEALAIMGKGEESSNSALNSFMNKTRSISNVVETTYSKHESPKIRNLTEHIMEEDRFPVLVYSFFIDTGIVPLREALEAEKLKCEEITGASSKEDVIDIVQKYNDRKVEVLLISGAAGFGLDLKRTASVHICEPNWNKAKIDQVIGRAIRFKSHHSLPVSERYVNVYYWLSVIPRGFFNKYIFGKLFKPAPSADEYLYEMSVKKDANLQLFTDAICSTSIENSKRKEYKTSIEIQRKGRSKRRY